MSLDMLHDMLLCHAGFMVSRMLGVAPTIADSIIEQLSKPCDKAVEAGEGRNTCCHKKNIACLVTTASVAV
jgi:hypothetical protein